MERKPTLPDGSLSTGTILTTGPISFGRLHRMDDRKARKTAQGLDAEANIRAHIEAYMRERGLTTAAMAKRLRVHDTHLGRILRGERGASVRLLLALREVLHRPADFLLDEAPGSAIAQLSGPRRGV